MKRPMGAETDNTNSNTETDNLVANTPGRMSYHKPENFSNASLTPEQDVRQI